MYKKNIKNKNKKKDLTINEYQRESNYHPKNHKLCTGFNNGQGNTGYQVIHHGDKVLDPYRAGWDLTAHEELELGNPCSSVDQYGTGFRDKPINTDYQYRFSGDKVLDPHRMGSDFTAQRNGGNLVSLPPVLPSNIRFRVEPGSIDFSKSMTKLLGSSRRLKPALKRRI